MRRCLISFLVVCIFLTMLVPISGSAGSLSSEPSADARIFIYDQGGSGNHNIGGSTSIYHGTRGWGTLMSYGCGFYVYLHAYQWLTGNKVDASNANDLISNMLNSISASAGTTAWDCRVDSYYATYLSKFGVKQSKPSMSVSSLTSHFDKGGVVKVYTPDGGSHFNLAVGIVYGDIDANGSQEYWVHIVDSSAYSNMKACEDAGYPNSCYSFAGHNKLTYDGIKWAATNNRRENNGYGLEYWVKYDTFQHYTITAGYLPGNPNTLGKPTLTCVAAGDTYTDSRFTWTEAANAIAYDFYIDDINGNNIYYVYGLTGTRWSVVLPAGNYKARVAACNVNLEQKFEFGNVVDFTVAAKSAPTDGTFVKQVEGNHELYKLFSKSCTWLEAKAIADRNPGVFVSITSAEEQRVIEQLLTGVNDSTWIGLQKYVNNNWTWEDGTKLSYSNWADGQPDDWIYADSAEMVGGIFADSYKWGDYCIHSPTPKNYIIEYQPTLVSVSAKEETVAPDHTVTKSDLTVNVTFEDGTVLQTEDYIFDVESISSNQLRVIVNYGNQTAETTISMIDPHTHVLGEPVYEDITGVTCYKDGTGIEVICCAECGAEMSRREVVIPASGHEAMAVAAVPPTRTSYGHTAGRVCAVCGEVLSGIEEIPMLKEAKVVKLPAALEELGEEAYKGSSMIEIVIVPDSCWIIASEAFADCASLRVVEIPASVTAIAEDAFDGSDNVVIVTTQNSPAAKYAERHSIDHLIKY